jgi:hypothetical protein
MRPSSRWRPPSSPRSAMSAATWSRSCAISWRCRYRPGARAARKKVGGAPQAAEDRVLDALAIAGNAHASTRDSSARSCAKASSTTRKSSSRWPTGPCRDSRCPACPEPGGGQMQPAATCSRQGLRRAHESASADQVAESLRGADGPRRPTSCSTTRPSSRSAAGGGAERHRLPRRDRQGRAPEDRGRRCQPRGRAARPAAADRGHAPSPRSTAR